MPLTSVTKCARVKLMKSWSVAEAALEKYFTPVTCFLVFNVLALVGNIATEFVRRVSVCPI